MPKKMDKDILDRIDITCFAEHDYNAISPKLIVRCKISNSVLNGSTQKFRTDSKRQVSLYENVTRRHLLAEGRDIRLQIKNK